jgi:Flp pilus assembly pilin Flp
MTSYTANFLVRCRQWWLDERGATAIEYALIAASVGAAIAATVWNLGSTVRDLYARIAGILA